MFERKGSTEIYQNDLFGDDPVMKTEPMDLQSTNYEDFLQDNIKFEPPKIQRNAFPEDSVFKRMKFDYNEDEGNIQPVTVRNGQGLRLVASSPVPKKEEPPLLGGLKTVDFKLSPLLPQGNHARRLIKKSKSYVDGGRRSDYYTFGGYTEGLNKLNFTTSGMKKLKVKKSNSKNVFIEKIRALLSDDDLRKKISSENT